MPVFFLTFLAAALATIAGREAVRVARLSSAHGSLVLVLVVIVLAVAVQAMLAVGLAATFAPMLPEPARPLFTALALALAAAEVLFLRAGPRPQEPTRSIGAMVLVLVASLLFGASGFLILAMAVATDTPVLAGAGGALGALSALVVASAAAEDWEKLPLAPLRYAGGGLLLVVALLNATGLL